MSDDETTCCQKVDVLEEKIRCERELRLAFEKLMNERNDANKEAIMAAFASATKAQEKAEENLKEYKIGANEWRDTVRDAIAAGTGSDKGKAATWAIVVILIGWGLTFALFLLKK